MPARSHHIVLIKYLLTLLVIFILSEAGYGQRNDFIVTGVVWDKASGAPIENANITVKGTSRGSISNAMGKFRLKVNSLPFYLEISHVGFETKTLVFEHKPLQEVQVYLEQRSEPLSEVVITSQRIDTLFADRNYDVLDYELTERGILLLVYKARLSRAELLLQDYAGKNQQRLQVLPMKPLALYKDCLNEVHILSREQSFQVAIDDDLTLLPPYGIETFNEVLGGCNFKIGDKLYFEDFHFYDLIKRFYYIDASENAAHLLKEVRDEEKIRFLSQNPENMAINSSMVESQLLGSMRGLKSDTAALNAIRNLTTELRFNKMAFLSKIYAPVYSLDDSILLFNHPENKIEFYDTSNALLGTTDIDYHLAGDKEGKPGLLYAFAKSSKWLQEVYVDEIKSKAYTLYQSMNGTRQLLEIDLKTGETEFRLSIPFPYVQKIKIRNGQVFFIYKGYGEGQKKKLFRQWIN